MCTSCLIALSCKVLKDHDQRFQNSLTLQTGFLKHKRLQNGITKYVLQASFGEWKQGLVARHVWFLRVFCRISQKGIAIALQLILPRAKHARHRLEKSREPTAPSTFRVAGQQLAIPIFEVRDPWACQNDRNTRVVIDPIVPMAKALRDTRPW